jgi:hypothetical protein
MRAIQTRRQLDSAGPALDHGHGSTASQERWTAAERAGDLIRGRGVHNLRIVAGGRPVKPNSRRGKQEKGKLFFWFRVAFILFLFTTGARVLLFMIAFGVLIFRVDRPAWIDRNYSMT